MTKNLLEKLLKYPTAIGRFVIVIVNNIYCIPTYVIWMVFLMPLKCINPDYYYKIEGVFFHWLIAIVSMWSYTAGYDVVEVGDDIEKCRNKRTLVIANHQSTADVPLLMANFNAKENIMPNIMWIMDRLFKFTNFGIVSVIHQDFFIASGRNKREESINDLKLHIKNSFIKRKRNWMVLFPEGGFLRKRKAVSQNYAKKNNLPFLEYVTLPRVGALKAIVDAMCTDDNDNKKTLHNSNEVNYKNNNTQKNNIIVNKNINYENNSSDAVLKQIKTESTDPLANGDVMKSSSNSIVSQQNKSTADTAPTTSTTIASNCLLDYVLDITIAYPNGIPLDLPNILHGFRDSCKTYMFYRLYNMNEVPKDGEALTNWLYDRFVEKNTLLENFYKTGEFVKTSRNSSISATVIQQDYLRFLLINIFFITSTYFHYQLFSAMFAYCFYFVSNVS